MDLATDSQALRNSVRGGGRRALAALIALVLPGCQAVQPAVAPDSAAAHVIRELEMARIPGGPFQMGDVSNDGERDELPVRTVTVRPFHMSRYEVTVAQFAAFVRATGYETDAERDANGHQGCVILEAGTAAPGYRPGTSWRAPGFAQTDRHPVVCVSFADAEAFVAWLDAGTGRHLRLPTEAEWELAARAGTKTTYSWGAEPSAACGYANGADETPGPAGERWTQRIACRDGYFNAAPVGSFRPNAFGLYDMLGNAWEWVADCYRDSFEGAPADGTAVQFEGCRKRTVRGGAWAYPAQWLRSANRGGSDAQLRANDRGFRLAE